MRRTSFSSPSPTGRKRSRRSWTRAKKSSGSSPGRRCWLAQRPCLRLLRLDAALPSAVRGPEDFLAFSRFALTWASVGGWGSFGFLILLSSTFRLRDGIWEHGGYRSQVVENRG